MSDKRWKGVFPRALGEEQEKRAAPGADKDIPRRRRPPSRPPRGPGARTLTPGALAFSGPDLLGCAGGGMCGTWECQALGNPGSGEQQAGAGLPEQPPAHGRNTRASSAGPTSPSHFYSCLLVLDSAKPNRLYLPTRTHALRLC